MDPPLHVLNVDHVLVQVKCMNKIKNLLVFQNTDF
jgi:hypothetical protein